MSFFKEFFRRGKGKASPELQIENDRLRSHRNIPIDGEITDQTANLTIAKMLFLQMDDKERPIDFFIRSPGGAVTAALAILDTMDFVDCPIRTFTAHAYGMAAIIAAHGANGQRIAIRHAELGFVPLISKGGKDIALMQRLTVKVHSIVAADTRNSVEQVREWFAFSKYFNPPEALANGLIDRVSGEQLSFDE